MIETAMKPMVRANPWSSQIATSEETINREVDALSESRALGGVTAHFDLLLTLDFGLDNKKKSS